MLPEVEKLLVLQDRDKRIRQLRLELKNAPLEKKQLEAALQAATASIEAVRLRAKELELERKKLELDAQSKRDMIGKYKAQQFQTRKNDEFRAIGNEIERFEQDIKAIEDRELDLMQSFEDQKKTLATAETEFSQTKNRIETQFADIDAKVKSIEVQLQEAEASRASLTGDLDEDLVERFQRLFTNKGEAVVALEHGVCMGCHMKVTVQTSTRAKSEREIVHCEQCGRILYYQE